MAFREDEFDTWHLAGQDVHGIEFFEGVVPLVTIIVHFLCQLLEGTCDILLGLHVALLLSLFPILLPFLRGAVNVSICDFLPPQKFVLLLYFLFGMPVTASSSRPIFWTLLEESNATPGNDKDCKVLLGVQCR